MRFLAASLIFLFTLANLAHAANSSANSEEGQATLPTDTSEIQESTWPDWFEGEFIQAGSLISTAVFNALGSIELVSKTFGSQSDKAKFYIGRVVYDNHDVANTYSVVDHVELDLSVPIYLPTVTIGTRTVSWGLGTTEGLVIEDIRQSRRKEITDFYAELPELKNQVQKWVAGSTPAGASGIGTAAPTTQGSNTTEIVSPTKNAKSDTEERPSFWSSITAWDPLRTAQYSQLWNVLSFPIRLPLKADSLKNLEDGEIISYNATGTLTLSFSVGWNFDPTSLSHLLETGASLSTYLNGDYEIAILKEDSRYAQVKVNRIYSRGFNEALGSEAQQAVISGYILHRRFDITQSIIPFEFSANQNIGHTFDVGYRFDMNDPAARAAYERAVLGNFEPAQTLCAKPLGSNDPPPVERMFTVNSADQGNSSTDELKVGFIFDTQQSDTVSISDAKIILPDGTSNVLQAITTDQDSNALLLGSTSQFQYKYTVYLDEDDYAQSKDNSFRLMAEGFLDDTSTHGDTLQRYMDEVELITGVQNVFPRPPVTRPRTGDENWFDHFKEFFESNYIAYGHANFYYRLSLTQAQTEQFINTTDGEIWPIMEQAYGVPPGTWANLWDRTLYGLTDDLIKLFTLQWVTHLSAPDVTSIPRLTYATIFANEWSDMHGIKDPVELSKRLANLFSSRWFSYEQMKALRIALLGDSVGYIASGSNNSFGYVWQEKNVITDSAVFQKLNKAENFDQPWNETSIDANSAVAGMGVQVLGADKMNIAFSTKILPNYVYFRINEQGLFTNPTRVEMTLNNSKGQFVSGLNELNIDSAHGSVDQNILNQLVKDHKYTLSMAVSQDGTIWGAREDLSFVFHY